MIRNPMYKRAGWFVPAILLTVFVLECCWFIRTQSLTFDEPIHIAEGLDAWRHHRFEVWNDHPPLARLWCTLPLFHNRAYQVDALQLVGPAGKISDIQPDPQAIAWRARAMIVILGVILAWLVWRTMRRMFSLASANLALALFVFSPSMVAHFSLATTDGIITLTLFATATGLLWWKAQPSLTRTVMLGVLLGFLLLSKFSAPPMFVVALFWILILHANSIAVNPVNWNWGKACVCVVVAAVVVWGGYFFHISHVEIRNGELTADFPSRTPFAHKVNAQHLNLSIALPAGEYFEGLWRVSQANKIGHPAFFLGTVSQRGGFKSYYPVTLILKWPLIGLAFFVIGAVLLITRKVRAPAGIWVLLSFPIIYFFLAIFARFDIGDRHILPLYPFLLVVAGATWEGANPRRLAKITLLAAVALLALDSLRSAPDYLGYFNFFVPRSQSFRLLTDSNLDWGQGLLALKKYENAHPRQDIWLAYFGSVDPAAYGIQARVLPRGERVVGTVVVSATALSGQYLKDPEGYRWVLQCPQIGLINGNMLVFNTKN